MSILAENTKEWVQQCNHRNRALWLEIVRIADVQDELVEALSTDVIIAFNNKSTELKVNNKKIKLVNIKLGR